MTHLFTGEKFGSDMYVPQTVGSSTRWWYKGGWGSIPHYYLHRRTDNDGCFSRIFTVKNDATWAIYKEPLSGTQCYTLVATSTDTSYTPETWTLYALDWIFANADVTTVSFKFKSSPYLPLPATVGSGDIRARCQSFW
jgi:hypothetical protein